MVRALFRIVLFLPFACGLCALAETNPGPLVETPPTNGPVLNIEVPEVRIGQIAPADIVTPITLVVINPEDSAVLKQQEGTRVPVICRYIPGVAEQVEKDLWERFAMARTNFLDNIESAFNHRKLSEQQIASAKFQRTINAFRKQHKTFPLSTNLAQIWAADEPDREALEPLVALVRAPMAHPVRSGPLPQELRFTWSVRLAIVTNWDEHPDLEGVQNHGLFTRGTNIISYGATKSQIQKSFPDTDKVTGKYLASFIRTNCAPDLELTRQARAKRVENIWASDRYEAGQVLVRAGQTIDKKTKLAIDQLREKTAVVRLRERPAVAQPAGMNLWVLYGFGGGSLIAILLTWHFARRGARRSMLPAPSGRGVIACPACDEPITVPALAGEETQRWLRPHFMRFLMNTFVRKLLSQRSELLNAQEQAAAEMAEMDARLEKIHAPLQERLRAYEARIAELEKGLAQKGAENQELIRAKIQMMRHQVEEVEQHAVLN